MQTETLVSLNNPEEDLAPSALRDAEIVFFFISPDYSRKEAYLSALKKTYPRAKLVGCTTGGEIEGNEALTKSAVSGAMKLEHSRIRVAKTEISDPAASFEAGKQLAAELDAPELRLIFTLTDGLKVNGSELVRGISGRIPGDVIISGGLAGDGPNFKQTGVGIDAVPESGVLAAVGFYGSKLTVSYGSVGGWLKFGPERLITRSKNNVLFELDGKPALDLYKKYLGEEAKGLPGSGLLFPLSIRPSADSTHEVVRTIVGISEKEKSLIFAGDVPQGYFAQLMRGNNGSLVDGAARAATLALEKGRNTRNSLALLVSCIGRNLLMGQQVSGEVEAVRQVLSEVPLVGFYSYGEICHHPVTHQCDLHNQTMTITLLSEVA